MTVPFNVSEPEGRMQLLVTALKLLHSLGFTLPQIISVWNDVIGEVQE